MISYTNIFFLMGALLIIIGGAMGIPLLLELFIYKTSHWQEFAFGVFITVSLGSLMTLANYKSEKMDLKVREAFIITTLSWIISTFFAGLPFYWSPLRLSLIDSWFEAVSAMTTTGATTIPFVEQVSHGILLWRSILQWLGGTGIILMALIVLPTLRIGGMQLFRSEFSDRSEKILPRVSQISTAIGTLYVVFTFVCGALYLWAEMPLFDAVCHAMSTVSTGGLSTKETSIIQYDSFLIEFISMIFMIIGSLTFVLFVRIWQGYGHELWRDCQVRAFLKILGGAIFLVVLWRVTHGNEDILKNVRESSFIVISFMSSTGYTTENYLSWGSFPTMLLLMLSIVGGCTGSTAGGIKVFRLQILVKVAITHLRHLRRPHGIYIPLYQKRQITESLATSVFTFITLYTFSLFFFTALLTSFNLDILSSFSATISMLGNVGPGITPGLSSHLYAMEPGAKVIMMICMILGRLELLTVYVLFMPSFWRR